jgi:prevent-host-death family protein
MSDAVFNIHAAKTHLSRLVDRASAGEAIVIARAGKPVARLVPITPVRGRRRGFGALKGRMRIGRDFDDPLPPELAHALGTGKP